MRWGRTATAGTAVGGELVGRTRELDRVDAVLAQLPGKAAGATAARGVTVVDVLGEPGIGKSRFLSEVCARAAALGCTVLRGRASEYERHVPYRVFADTLADVPPSTPHAATVSAALAHAAGLAPDDGPPGEPAVVRFELHRAVSALLAGMSGPGLLLAVDDLHWADPASRELLDHLVRHPVPGPTLLVVARRGRQSPDTLAAVLTRGADGGTVLPLRLGPLPKDETLRALAADLPPDRAERLWSAGEGNPLYLHALLHAERAGTPLHDPAPDGTSAGPAPAATADAAEATPAGRLPEGLTALLLDELAPLSAAQRQVVEAVAVLGEDATTGMLAAVTGQSRLQVAELTAALADRDTLRPAAGGRWRLRHPVVRALVHDGVPAHHRAAVHRAAAAELARRGAPATARAHHVAQASDTWDADDAAVLTAAARQLAATAPATAAHLLGVALSALPATAPYDRQRGELLLDRARALSVSGGLRESRDLLHGLVDDNDPGRADLRARAIAQCAVTERHLGHSPEAAALLRRELSRVPGPPPDLGVSLRLALGMAALLTATYPQARADVARAVTLAREAGDAAGEAAALALSALGEAYEGDTAAAGRFADAAAGLADALTDTGLGDPCESLVWLGWAEALLERYPDAERHADRGLAVARRTRRLHLLPHLLASKAFVCVNTCRLPAALEAAEEAESVARAAGGDHLLAFTLAIKTLVLLVAGPLGDGGALAAAEEAVSLTDGAKGWWSALAWCMLGHAAFVSGDPHRAMESIVTAGGGHDLAMLQPSIRPGQLDTLVGAALATGDRSRAARWAAQAAREADRLGLEGQRAAALRAEAALAEERGELPRAVRLLDAAAREHARIGGTTWEAYALLRLAPLARRAGQEEHAAAAWHRGQAIVTRGGAGLLAGLAELIRPQVLPEVPKAPPELAALTPRELEVALMVARGLSNQDIADRMRLSRRTVETHLSAIYRKAMVPSRSALAGLVTRAGLGG